MFQNIRNNKGYITLIEFLVIAAIIAIFTALLIPVINDTRKKAEANKAHPAAAQDAQAEDRGRTITLEWKQGVRATPETIEIVYGVRELSINERNELVLTITDGSQRNILRENLVEYREETGRKDGE